MIAIVGFHKRPPVHILKEFYPIPWEQRMVVWRDDLYTIERLEHPWDMKLEGYFLGHCVGTKDAAFLNRHSLFSLRDRVGVPHATILLAYSRVLSEYGRSDDLFGSTEALIDRVRMQMLQIRGRDDRIARPEYHARVREWWRGQGGQLHRSAHELDTLCRTVWPDGDRLYHYSYTFRPHESVFYDPDFAKELTANGKR